MSLRRRARRQGAGLQGAGRHGLGRHVAALVSLCRALPHRRWRLPHTPPRPPAGPVQAAAHRPRGRLPARHLRRPTAGLLTAWARQGCLALCCVALLGGHGAPRCHGYKLLQSAQKHEGAQREGGGGGCWRQHSTSCPAAVSSWRQVAHASRMVSGRPAAQADASLPGAHWLGWRHPARLVHALAHLKAGHLRQAAGGDACAF